MICYEVQVVNYWDNVHAEDHVLAKFSFVTIMYTNWTARTTNSYIQNNYG